jgi:hypothetical protein
VMIAPAVMVPNTKRASISKLRLYPSRG